MIDKLLTPKEVWEALRISKPFFYTLLAKGELPAGILIGSSRRWPEKVIQKILDDKFKAANSGKAGGK